MGDKKKEICQTEASTKQVQASTEIESTNELPNGCRSLDKMKNVVLPKILKMLMKQKSVSVRSLAKECSLPVSTIGSYLSAKKASYSPDHLERLATYFDVSIDYLLFGEDRQSGVNAIATELFYEGWLNVKILRAIPHLKK